MTKVVIVGGGAAGMMAAATVAELNKTTEILLIERNATLGMKVIISGGGRCNVTTGVQDISTVLRKFPRGEKFLRPAIYNFPPKRLYEWIEAHGVQLKVERDLRVFPQSNNGKDIVGLFEKLFLNSRINFLLKTAVNSVSKESDKFIIGLTDGKNIQADKLILTTGGQAYRHTGSQGDGYTFAEALGHKITPLAASLSAFLVVEQWVKELSGVSFEKVGLRLVKNQKHEFAGPILFTHRGVTGPAIFAISALAAFEEIEKSTGAKLFIDFCPQWDYDNLRRQFMSQFSRDPRKLFQATISSFVPKSLAKKMCELSEIALNKLNMEVGKKDLNKIIELLKNTEINLNGKTAGEEFVTAGGVALEEVNSKTMESKICPGLYFAGEILDIDGFTGGFNLQAAWATGRLAGEAICKIEAR